MASKKNISVRLGVADLRRVKEIALRLQVKESDLFRFAVKSLGSRLMPVLNRQLCGVPMLVALLENCEELLHHFEFDAHHLDQLINAHCEDGERAVELDDIEMLAIAVINPDYIAVQLSEKTELPVEPATVFAGLRHYLFRKYKVRQHLFAAEAEQELA